ncbi:barstar family protein [Dyadobacter luticola]|uniref:Barstar family protein n=1 Tax=Dyadobacter luticola TaxID=1979387 RepID=A0A5R9KNP4_9BACT|nr:barstar family protein [Dyadobacter luticola]TLU97895.1 barstar family protein [Dyadobacter luticola]
MKNTHFLIAQSESDVRKSFKNAFIAKIDGSKTASLKDFYTEISAAMQLDDEPVKNLESLDEILNDLSWIEESKVIIFIDQSADWLSKEKSADKILSVIDILDATAEDWKWLDEGEEGVSKKDLQIIFQDSTRIRSLLEDQEIPFGELE